VNSNPSLKNAKASRSGGKGGKGQRPNVKSDFFYLFIFLSWHSCFLKIIFYAYIIYVQSKTKYRPNMISDFLNLFIYFAHFGILVFLIIMVLVPT
jgi:hypothetical protein